MWSIPVADAKVTVNRSIISQRGSELYLMYAFLLKLSMQSV